MGMSMGGGGDGRRYRRKGFSDINITPMVDVMLVLLIIFMVTAPLMTAGIQVDLPESAAAPITGQDEPLSISIKNDGKIFLNKTEVAQDELAEKLAAITGEKRDTRIFVRGDKTLDYGRVMGIVGAISAAGFTKVALVTAESQSPAKADR